MLNFSNSVQMTYKLLLDGLRVSKFDLFYVNYSFKMNEGTCVLLNNKLCLISVLLWAKSEVPIKPLQTL